MHDPSYLRRSSLLSHTGAKVGLAAIFTAGIVTAVALRPTEAPVIEVQQAAAVHQTTVVPFAVPSVLVIPALAPPEAPEPDAAEPATPRALVPMINSACLLGGSCDWDDGFPATRRQAVPLADPARRGAPGW